MARPKLDIESRDWLGNKELRRCSTLARSVLIDMMCLASEGIPYGHLSDKSGPIPEHILASRFVLSEKRLSCAVEELKKHKRIQVSEGTGAIYVPRMVSDEALRAKRAAGGRKSIAHPNVAKPKFAEAEEARKSAVVDMLVTAVAQKLPELQYHLPSGSPHSQAAGSTPAVIRPSTDGFTAWWSLWSSVKGTPNEQQALQAWISSVPENLVHPAMECTRSYLQSLDNPARGFNPENFLFQQAKSKFGARWPENKRRAARDTGAEVAELARQRFKEEGRL